MSRRDRSLEILRRKRPGEVLMAIEFDSYAYKTHRDRLGGKSAGEYFDLWYRYLRLDEAAGRREADYTAYYDSLPAEARIDSWGTAKVGNEQEAVRHFYPMRRLGSIAEIDAYPFPDFTRPACSEGLAEEVRDLKSRGLVTVGATSRVVFPICRHLRGMEEFLIDLYENPGFAEHLLDRVTACRLEIVRALVRSGIDVLWLGIDVATQTSTMISPAMWARYIKPRMKLLFDEARNLNGDILLAIHCCGNVVPILDQLVEIGLDILNPLQPESMDMEALRRDYGGRLAFWGGVSIQRSLPRGTPEEVREEVRERVRVLGREGSYVVCPAHHLTHDVSWENITAFVEEARSFAVCL